MCTPGIKLGLSLPASLHERMVLSASGQPRGALQAAYGEALGRLLDAVEAGDGVVFAAVRGPKVRVTVRLSQDLCDRLREALARLNLKVTDFACTALDRYLAPLEGSRNG
jgi:hypothetical protein